MGRSGRTAFKHGADCPCTSGEFPSGKRLGAVYGCNHTGSQCTGPANRIYVVGKTGTEQDTDADQSKASDPDSAASKPTVCVPGIFRMQAFQQGKWVFTGEWCGTDWLADWEYIKNRWCSAIWKNLWNEECPDTKASGLLWKNLSSIKNLFPFHLWVHCNSNMWIKYEQLLNNYKFLCKTTEMVLKN